MLELRPMIPSIQELEQAPNLEDPEKAPKLHQFREDDLKPHEIAVADMQQTGSSANVYKMEIDINGVNTIAAVKIYREGKENDLKALGSSMEELNVYDARISSVLDLLGIGPAYYGMAVTDSNRLGYVTQYIDAKANEQGELKSEDVETQVRDLYKKAYQSGFALTGCEVLVDQNGRVYLLDPDTVIEQDQVPPEEWIKAKNEVDDYVERLFTKKPKQPVEMNGQPVTIIE